MRTGNKDRVTDLHYLVGLSEGNDEFVREMVHTFVMENPKELREMADGISARDYDQIRNGAHRMRSTIPFVGIDAIIGQDVSEIEQLAKRREALGRIEELFGNIREICSRALIELSEE